MEQSFFICNHCGNMIAFVNDSGNPVVCCGELMHEVIPGAIDASIEKHVPVYSVKDDIVHVDVGSILHPILSVESVTGLDEEEEIPSCPPAGSIFMAFRLYALRDTPFVVSL